MLHLPEDGWSDCVAFRYFFDWNALLHQPEDVQIIDVEFLHFFVPHSAMHYLLDENIYVLRYPDFLK